MPKPRHSNTAQDGNLKATLALLQKAAKSNADDSKQMLVILQNLFIIQGTQAGMDADDIRQLLRVATKRVTDVTKHTIYAKSSAKSKGKGKTG